MKGGGEGDKGAEMVARASIRMGKVGKGEGGDSTKRRGGGAKSKRWMPCHLKS